MNCASFITSANEVWEVMFLVLPVCLSVRRQDYFKSNQPISLKLILIIEPTSGKSRLTFGGDPVPGVDS